LNYKFFKLSFIFSVVPYLPDKKTVDIQLSEYEGLNFIRYAACEKNGNTYILYNLKVLVSKSPKELRLHIPE
jgi:hypothetical protein